MTVTSDAREDFDFDVVHFVTSDHHFGHARISELAARPFDTVDEMNTSTVDRWNARVGPDASCCTWAISRSVPLSRALR